MRSTFPLAAIAAVAGMSTSAFAGFTFSFSKSDLSATEDAVLVRALNDGVGTGTKLSAINLTFTMVPPSAKVYFFVDDSDLDGTPDQVQIPNAGNGVPNGLAAGVPFVRLGTASDTFVVSSNPTKNVVQPNPWLGGVNQFSVTATTLNAPVANTGTGALIARLIISNNAGFNITGTLGGDMGPAVAPGTGIIAYIPGGDPAPVTFGSGTLVSSADARQSLTTVNANPGTDSYTLTIDFGNLGSSPSTFTIDTNLTGDAPINLQAGTATGVPALGAQSVTGLNLINGDQVTGTINGSYRGTITIPLTATNGAGADAATLTIIAVPEPATLGLGATFGLIALHRRRAPVSV